MVLNDVTRLRRLENLRRDFVANVSHELKTPITSIKGFVETLIDGAIRDPGAADRFLRIISRQADRLSAIIEDLLQLSRIERGTERQEIELRPHPLVTVLRGAVELCQPQAEEEHMLIELDCPRDLVAAINPPLLESALVNLIDNALKYGGSGGRVRVALREAEREAVISVQDWGAGIASAHLPRLFERFYRVDQSRDRKAGGSGLGLSIVKHIAQAHAGRVEVESKVGAGSTFSLHLPRI
jgi:two-component system phosphate regulon sensor histidine kinase PhoR